VRMPHYSKRRSSITIWPSAFRSCCGHVARGRVQKTCHLPPEVHSLQHRGSADVSCIGPADRGAGRQETQATAKFLPTVETTISSHEYVDTKRWITASTALSGQDAVMSRVAKVNLLRTKIGLYHERSDPMRKGDKGQSVGEGQHRSNRREKGPARKTSITARMKKSSTVATTAALDIGCP